MRVPRRGWRHTRKPAPVGPAPIGMWAMREQYLDDLRVRNFSAETVKTRGSGLRSFLTWCDERSLMEPTDVTQPVVERYQRWLYYHRRANGKPLTVQVQAQMLRGVRMFFGWLTRHHLTLFNPASEIEMPRFSRKLPRDVLTAQEAEAVIKRPDVSTPIGVRDRAILETFYATGIRRRELAQLKLYDLDGARGTLTVRQGKGGKDRVLPMGRRAREWIDAYLTEVRPDLGVAPDEGYLFLTVDGTPYRKMSLLNDLVNKYLAAAQVGKKGSCHIFRHTMATLMLENGADIRFIQEMLGHADLTTTEVYTHVSIAKLAQIYRATHPAELEEAEAPHEDPQKAHEDVGEEDHDPIH